MKQTKGGIRISLVLYMPSSFWQLGVESRDFSHAEKERTACKDEQIHNYRGFLPYENFITANFITAIFQKSPQICLMRKGQLISK